MKLFLIFCERCGNTIQKPAEQHHTNIDTRQRQRKEACRLVKIGKRGKNHLTDNRRNDGRKEQKQQMMTVKLQKKPGISLLMHRKNW